MRTQMFRSFSSVFAMRNVLMAAFTLSLIALIAGCGGGGNEGGGGSITVSSVTASVSPASVTVGSPAQASCVVTMSDGTSGSGCTFSSSNVSVASINAATGAITTFDDPDADHTHFDGTFPESVSGNETIGGNFSDDKGSGAGFILAGEAD